MVRTVRRRARVFILSIIYNIFIKKSILNSNLRKASANLNRRKISKSSGSKLISSLLLAILKQILSLEKRKDIKDKCCRIQ